MFKGKVGSLQYLKDLGLNVPQWNVIQHEEIISKGNNALFEELQAHLFESNIERIQNSAKQFVNSMKIPERFKIDRYYAVRSSANVEDSSEHSFAGIFESKLFIKEDLTEAIKSVWLSLYSSNALKYCKEKSISYSVLKMNVIVQEMIEGEKSGVLFQADPSGNLIHQVIVAGWGLGQGIVDNLTDTDRYLISGHQLSSSEIRSKNKMLSYKNELSEEKVPFDKRDIPVLSKNDLDQLIQCSRLISGERFFDIEFTFKDEMLYVLQARPITTLHSKKNIVIFDNSNIAENYPGQSLPLTYSTLQRAYAENFNGLIDFLGFPLEEKQIIKNKLEKLVGYWGGQVYYNLNNWYAVYSLLPIGANSARDSFNDMVGIKHESTIYGPKRTFWAKARILLKILPRFIHYYFFTESHHRQYKKDFKVIYEKYKLKIKNAESAFDVISLIEDLDTEYYRITKVPLFNDFCSSIFHKICRTLSQKIAGDNSEHIYNDLFSHREDLESSRAIYSLINLAQLVRSNTELLLYLEENLYQDDVQEMIERNFEPFGKALREHFDRFGDRSQWEMKLEVPTAREVPSTTIRLIIDYAHSDMNQEEQRKRERNTAQKAEEELRSHCLKKPLSYFFFSILFKKCTKTIAFREDSRFDRVRMKGLSREIVLKLGVILSQKNYLRTKEDIFYLTQEEIMALTYDSYGPDYYPKLVDLRKEQLLKQKDLKLNDRMILNDLHPAQRFKTHSVKSGDGLHGLPCSGGIVEAEVVVVKDLNTAPNLTGKILVAHRTDPSWGYFFVGVKGIIIEKGSQLSHAAIISRELGIPCIINVENATDRLISGQKIQMNGDTGEIEILVVN